MVDDNENVADNTVIGNTSVFLAWSGSVSQKMAVLLKKYLPLFVRSIDIFLSKDITKGKRWHTEIANALGSTRFGILCLTPENLVSEWIHFEAGALSKTIDDSTHVCPLLLDVKKSELKEPLASFHATLFDEKEFKKLVNDLAHACGDSLDEGQLTTLMEALWPKINDNINDLKAELAEARQKSGEPEDAEPKIDPLLEEVVVRVREQGRLLTTLADQGGAGLGKEIIEAVQDMKMMRQYMEMYDNRLRLFRDREEDDSVRANISSKRRIIRKKLANIIHTLPAKLVAMRDPEAILDFLIRTDQLSERMLESLRGRAGAIEAIDYIMRRDAHGSIEDDKT